MSKTDKETKFTVTEKEYQKDLAKGWTDDDTLKPGNYVARRSRFIDTKSGDNKIKITMNVDADILEHFKKMSVDSGAGYQTLINRALRDAINGSSKPVNDIEKLLEDKDLLRRLKSKLEAV